MTSPARSAEERETPPIDVFVSYAHADRECAERLVCALEEAGLSVFLDRTGLVAGDPLNEEIEASLERAGLVVVLWSQTSVESNWVVAEAHTALTMKKLVQALLDDTLPPLQFRPWLAADLRKCTGASIAALVSKVAAAVRGDKRAMRALRGRVDRGAAHRRVLGTLARVIAILIASATTFGVGLLTWVLFNDDLPLSEVVVLSLARVSLLFAVVPTLLIGGLIAWSRHR